MSTSTITSGPLIFGEVLYDCFPDGSRILGGAPFNVAWHCQAFGLQPLFVSRVGDDAMGHTIAEAMRDWGMATSALQFDAEHATGVVNVSFSEGEPAYDIVANSAWDFIAPELISESGHHSMLYHGSLALRNAVSAASLQALQAKYPSPVFIDVNLRAPWWQRPQLEGIITNARWLKLNADELALIVPQHDNVIARVQSLFSRYTIELIIVTQGEAGATAYTPEASTHIPIEKLSKVVDTVGAGDAFSSVLLLGLVKHWPLQTLLQRAQQFASAVVGQRGATTQDNTFYAGFIRDWDL